jgi:hypothetical protein
LYKECKNERTWAKKERSKESRRRRIKGEEWRRVYREKRKTEGTWESVQGEEHRVACSRRTVQ